MARWASFSQVSSTSPMPFWTKVVVEPRAPLSSTGTLANSFCRKARALASVAPRLAFGEGVGDQVGSNRAPPPVFGLAVTTWTPGLTRSDQGLDPPSGSLRTRRTMVEV